MVKMLCALERVNEDVRLVQLTCRSEGTGSDIWQEVTMVHQMKLAPTPRGACV